MSIIIGSHAVKYSSDLIMHRFFIPSDWIKPPLVSFQGDTARQIFRVLRLTNGEVVTVLDGTTTEHQVRLDLVEQDRVEGEIISSQPAFGEPHTNLSLYISSTQRTKFEWILQKGTEVGVSTFIPVITSRSLVRDTSEVLNKTARWKSILREAAEQCGRGHIPVLQPVMNYSEALTDSRKKNSLCLIPWEKERSGDLKDILSHLDHNKPTSTAILIGPEGGFSDEEAGQAIAEGWIPISLGVRILRMETAALVMAALVLYELGDLKPPAGAATDS